MMTTRRPVAFSAGRTRAIRSVAVEVPVREVEPRHVQAGAKQASSLARLGRRSDRDDDLRLVVGQCSWAVGGF